MKVQQPGNPHKMITIERQISPLRRWGLILLVPAMLVFFFWAIFIIETRGLSPSSDFLNVLLGCILEILAQGCTECIPDLGYIIFCSILGGPFAIIISYKIWQSLNTKIIFTDQSIIKKQSWSKETQIGWNEIKKIKVLKGDKGMELMFTRNKGSAIFDNSNRIFCLLILRYERSSVSSAAANLILAKIDTYNISVKGERKALEEMAQKTHQLRHSPSRPAASPPLPNHPRSWS